ncbi:histone-lysine N-methyltransferase SMYD3-like isoform X2 [Paramacrobiotus metropolitanus]|uniref:histone-lysine N-methyltransferase SMYD3-like isoform X2 n=1 Tax=Paramacrobiotus metropolitanus TaxID=2943436 RepID=UPI002445A34B|nr:histone-lysine N-methyltransferase SMYD3-like isoform X2 [Paramacrobiotus metropolitanus]
MAIRKGQRVLYNEPWVWVLEPAVFAHYCDFCFAALDQHTTAAFEEPNAEERDRLSEEHPSKIYCPYCQCACYCSKTCLANHAASLHGLECAYIQRVGASSMRMLPRSARCVFLALLKVTKGQTDESNIIAEPKAQRTWERLLSHWERFRQRTTFMEHACTVHGLIQLLRTEHRFSLEQICEALGKFAVNAFTIMDRQQNEVGCGIYLSGSRFDHACRPNASKYFSGRDLVVYALEDVASLEDVRLSYGVLYEHPGVRRDELHEKYHFRCTCAVCGNPQQFRHHEDLMNGWRCQRRASDDFQIFYENDRTIKEVKEQLLGCVKLTDNQKRMDVVRMAFAVRIDSVPFLSPSNRHLHELNELLTIAAEASQHLGLALHCCAETLQPYSIIYPEGSFEVLQQVAKFIHLVSRYMEKHDNIPKKTASFYAGIACIFAHKCEALGVKLPLLPLKVMNVLDRSSVKKHVDVVFNNYLNQSDIYTVKKLIKIVTAHVQNSKDFSL